MKAVLRGLVILLVVPAVVACAADSTYGCDRLADLGDIIDLRYGRSMGLGVKVEATHFLGVGLGWASLTDVTESYGRYEAHTNDGEFLHFVIAGADGQCGPCMGSSDTCNFDILGVNVIALTLEQPPESTDWFRFGGEILLPFVTGGIYLNVGQLVDGVAGIATFDPAEDDQATELERERKREDALRADRERTPPSGEP